MISVTLLNIFFVVKNKLHVMIFSPSILRIIATLSCLDTDAMIHLFFPIKSKQMAGGRFRRNAAYSGYRKIFLKSDELTASKTSNVEIQPTFFLISHTFLKSLLKNKFVHRIIIFIYFLTWLIA